MNFSRESGNSQFRDFTARERLECRKAVLDQIDEGRALSRNRDHMYGCEKQLMGAELADLDQQVEEYIRAQVLHRYAFLLVQDSDGSYTKSFQVDAPDPEVAARFFAAKMNWLVTDFVDVFREAKRRGFTLWIHAADPEAV